MSIFLICWVVAGIIFTAIEHFSYDWSPMDEMSRAQIVLNILHQLIHYTRCIIVWPWYLLEDLLIIIDNKLLGDDE